MLRIFLPLFITLLATGCTQSKVSLKPEYDRSISQVALLPAQAGAGIQRENAAYLQAAVENELRNHGYIVLEDAVVNRVCAAEAACPGREILTERYGAQGFFQLTIESVSRNNFLAGFVNVISGTLSLKNAAGAELASISQDQSERGGLLFNSGQIFQGFISQVKNSDPQSFQLLGDKFAKSLVAELPAIDTQAVGDPQNADITLRDPVVQKRGPGIYQICAEGDPGNLGYLVFSGQRSTLREIKRGRYCGIFRLYADSHPAIELRSPFGEVARRELMLDASSACDLSGRARLTSDSDRPEIILNCVQLSAEKPAADCGEKIAQCPNNRFLVYHAAAATGPFRKVGEFSEQRWSDKNRGGGIYQLVAIHASGVRSNPVSVSGE